MTNSSNTVDPWDAFAAKVKHASQSCENANIRDSTQYVSSPLWPSSSRKERIVGVADGKIQEAQTRMLLKGALTAAGNLSKTAVSWYVFNSKTRNANCIVECDESPKSRVSLCKE